MSSEQLAAIAGIVLSLGFSYTPGLSDWYGGLDATKKRLIMAALLFVVAAGTFGLSCAKVVGSVACTKDGALALVYAFIAALVANQAAFQLSPRRQIFVADGC